MGVYQQLLERVFFDRWKKGAKEIAFHRDDLPAAAKILGLKLPRNLGDVVYSVRYRTPLPESVRKKAPRGMEWVIEGAGRSKYRMRLVPASRIEPNPHLASTKIPDSTPEIISSYSLSDEQALLAKVRYNRLVDIFLGIAAFSLQNHLRTTVENVGQIEIDELYVGVDQRGRQFVVPVQAKGGSDKLGVVQTKQDLDYCAQQFPDLICRAVATQFLANDHIAMFELTVEGDNVQVVEERHYRLVPGSQITASDLAGYRKLT